MKLSIKTDLSKLRREEGSKSLLAFAMLYMQHHMQFLPSEAHIELYDLLDKIIIKRGAKIAVAAPRDFGKSTMITLFYIIYCIAYSKEKFMMIISNTASQANQILDNIKKEWTENELLKSDFPEIFEFKLGFKQLRWREGDIITRNNIKILTLGSGQQVRGRRFGNARPTLVIADDLENAENTFSQDVRDKTKDWFEKSVLKVGSESTNYIFIGNLYHPYSLLGEYVSPDTNQTWIKRVYSAIVTWPIHMDLWDKWSNVYNYRESFKDASGLQAAFLYYRENKSAMDEGAKLLWPARYSLYDLMKIREENDFSFMSELQNMPLNPKECLLDTDKIVYWDHDGKSTDDLVRSLGENVKYYIGCDPSLGLSTVKGDYSAIVVLAKDEVSKTLYIVEADIKRRPIEEIADDIIAYCLKYNPTKVGIEGNHFQRVLIDIVKKKAEEIELYPPIVEVINKDDKVARIQSLRPRIKSGNLQFSKKHRHLLEEARYFPRGRHDDGLDSLEMAVRLSNDNGVMFWFGGGSKNPPPDEPIYPTADGLMPYGFYRGRRC